jgi:hypothetical protein
MSLLVPLMLLFGLLGIPIILMYMLRLRRRDEVVSSTYLWQQILKDQQANAPWQRLKYHILLIIQLLILIALVLALARPAVSVQTLVSGPTVILLDGSASMYATDVAPNRFEVAKTAAHLLIDDLAGNTPVTIILAGIQARLLVSNETNHAAVYKVLSDAHADQGGADWKGAFSLAAGAAKSKQGNDGNTSTVIISDGGVPDEGLPSLAGTVKYIPIGKSNDNLGITSLAVRAAPAGLQLFASVQNFGTDQRQVILSCYGDDQLFQSKQVNLDGGKRQDLVIEGAPQGAKRFMARLSPAPGGKTPIDALALDDTAYTIYQPASGGNVLLMSQGNVFLKQLLGSMPGVTPYVMLPGADKQLQVPSELYDVYILDGMIPAALPSGNLLILNPPKNDYFQVDGSFTDTMDGQLTDNPLNRFVDWSNVHIARAQKVILPGWGKTLIQANGGPLVFVGETGGRRLAVVTFDLHDSDLPLQITYPILFSNLMQYLARSNQLSVDTNGVTGQADTAVDTVKEDNLQIQPGARILITPHDEVGKIEVVAPDGSIQAPVTLNGKTTFDRTQQVGLYSVRFPDHADIPPDQFAVNLFNGDEENILPKTTLFVGQKQLTATTETVLGQREYWPWLAGIGLAILMLEWWLYHRQQSPYLKWDRKG